jgi:hypothetical protein
MISTAPKNFMRSQVVIASDDEAGLGGLGTLHRCHKGGRKPTSSAAVQSNFLASTSATSSIDRS